MMMQRLSVILRTLGKSLAGAAFGWAALFAFAAITPDARADVEGDKKLAYLIQIAARPGYGFASADAALNYGYGICDKVSQGRGYAQLIVDVQGDINTSDVFQASYLIDRAVNELCPEQIWQLRNSAAHYRPPPVPAP